MEIELTNTSGQSFVYLEDGETKRQVTPTDPTVAVTAAKITVAYSGPSSSAAEIQKEWVAAISVASKDHVTVTAAGDGTDASRVRVGTAATGAFSTTSLVLLDIDLNTLSFAEVTPSGSGPYAASIQQACDPAAFYAAITGLEEVEDSSPTCTLKITAAVA